MERIDDVRKFVKALDAQTLVLGTKLEPILKKSLDELVESAAGLSAIDRIPILNNFTYTLIAVIFSFMKSQGINTDTHPIMKELDRIKAAMARYKELQLHTANKALTEQQQAERAREFLQNTLGVKGSLGGAVDTKTAEPAISKFNFQGKHTKFADENAPINKSTKQNSNNAKSNTSAGKISKPKSLPGKNQKPNNSKMQ